MTFYTYSTNPKYTLTDDVYPLKNENIKFEYFKETFQHLSIFLNRKKQVGLQPCQDIIVSVKYNEDENNKQFRFKAIRNLPEICIFNTDSTYDYDY